MHERAYMRPATSRPYLYIYMAYENVVWLHSIVSSESVVEIKVFRFCCCFAL